MILLFFMKLLLTSSGITNASIAKALADLVGKKLEDTSVVFIPTAANAQVGDKGWLINDLVNLKKQNFKQIDIADISGTRELWKPKLEKADILFFGGGDEYYLMEWINKSGLTLLLPELFKTKVYVGVSAGSMVTNKNLGLIFSHILYEDCFDRTEDMVALNVVTFYTLPHLNSHYFKKLRKENIQEVVNEMSEKVYALDDNSALKVVDGKVEIISEGTWLEFN